MSELLICLSGKRKKSCTSLLYLHSDKLNMFTSSNSFKLFPHSFSFQPAVWISLMLWNRMWMLRTAESLTNSLAGKKKVNFFTNANRQQGQTHGASLQTHTGSNSSPNKTNPNTKRCSEEHGLVTTDVEMDLIQSLFADKHRAGEDGWGEWSGAHGTEVLERSFRWRYEWCTFTFRHFGDGLLQRKPTIREQRCGSLGKPIGGHRGWILKTTVGTKINKILSWGKW